MGTEHINLDRQLYKRNIRASCIGKCLYFRLCEQKLFDTVVYYVFVYANLSPLTLELCSQCLWVFKKCSCLEVMKFLLGL